MRSFHNTSSDGIPENLLIKLNAAHKQLSKMKSDFELGAGTKFLTSALIKDK